MVAQRSVGADFYGLQFLDVNQGPLDRRWGMASLSLQTASAHDHTTRIAGLPLQEAHALRAALLPLTRGRASEAQQSEGRKRLHPLSPLFLTGSALKHFALPLLAALFFGRHQNDWELFAAIPVLAFGAWSVLRARCFHLCVELTRRCWCAKVCWTAPKGTSRLTVSRASASAAICCTACWG